MSVAVSAGAPTGAAAAGHPGGTGSTRGSVAAPFMRAGVPGSKLTAGPQCDCSFNWAGYAQVATVRATYTQVTDTFVVPSMTSSRHGVQYVADWVGIGGYNDRTLVQTGIQTLVRTRKHQTTVSYMAWTEQLPQYEQPLDLVISAGDTVTATVQEVATDSWSMTVDDISTGQSAGRTVSYQSSGLSAEVIHERPCLRAGCGPKALAHLAQTSNVTFVPGTYSVTPPGQPPVERPLLENSTDSALGDENLSVFDITMIGNDGSSHIATPSSPDGNGDGFTVADGAQAPPAPTV
jgi:hypothetical protein